MRWGHFCGTLTPLPLPLSLSQSQPQLESLGMPVFSKTLCGALLDVYIGVKQPEVSPSAKKAFREGLQAL